MLIYLLLAFLSGALLLLIFQLLLIYLWFTKQPKVLPQVTRENNPVTNPRHVSEFCATEGATSPESCTSLNLLLGFLWREWRDAPQTRALFLRKIHLEFEEMLVKRTAGRLMESIRVRDYYLGDSLPVIKNATVMKIGGTRDPSQVPRDLDLALEIEYGGGFEISLDVELIFGKTASLSVKLRSLVGRVRLQFTRNPCTHWSFAFYEDPMMDLSVESQFEGRSLPQLTSLISAQIRKSIRKKHTLPRYKVRYKPFFTSLQPQDGKNEVYVHNHLLTVGHLEVEVVECSRLALLGCGSHVYCTLSVDGMAREEDMPTRKAMWPVSEVVIERAPSGAIGVSFTQKIVDQGKSDRREYVVTETITPNMPAASTDIQHGDILLSVNGVDVNSMKQAVRLIRTSGNRLVFKVQRPPKGAHDLAGAEESLEEASPEAVKRGGDAVNGGATRYSQMNVGMLEESFDFNTNSVVVGDEDSDTEEFVNIVVQAMAQDIENEEARKILRKVSHSARQRKLTRDELQRSLDSLKESIEADEEASDDLRTSSSEYLNNTPVNTEVDEEDDESSYHRSTPVNDFSSDHPDSSSSSVSARKLRSHTSIDDDTVDRIVPKLRSHTSVEDMPEDTRSTYSTVSCDRPRPSMTERLRTRISDFKRARQLNSAANGHISSTVVTAGVGRSILKQSKMSFSANDLSTIVDGDRVEKRDEDVQVQGCSDKRVTLVEEKLLSRTCKRASSPTHHPLDRCSDSDDDERSSTAMKPDAAAVDPTSDHPQQIPSVSVISPNRKISTFAETWDNISGDIAIDDTDEPPVASREPPTSDCRTSESLATDNPIWNEIFAFQTERQHKVLNICVWSKSTDRYRKDTLIGYVAVPLMEIALECLATSSHRNVQTYILTGGASHSSASRSALRGMSMPGMNTTCCHGDITLACLYVPSVAECDLPGEEIKRIEDELSGAHALKEVSPSVDENAFQLPEEKTLTELQIYEEHSFMGTNFYFPTICQNCQKKVWTKVAYQCRVCAMICHKKCMKKAQTNTYCTSQGVRGKRNIIWDQPNAAAKPPIDLEVNINEDASNEDANNEDVNNEEGAANEAVRTQRKMRISVPDMTDLRPGIARTLDSGEGSPLLRRNLSRILHKQSNLEDGLNSPDTGSESTQESDYKDSITAAADVAKEAGKEYYASMDGSDDRKGTIQAMVEKLQGEIDKETANQRNLRHHLKSDDPELCERIGIPMRKSEERSQGLSLLMIQYCAALDECLDDETLRKVSDREKKDD